LRLSMAARVGALGAAALACLAWAIPLIAASGGLEGYLAALGTQAGEDFAGVVMLWTTPRPRVALDAALYSFVWPWGTIVLAAIVLALAAAGFAIVGWRRPRSLVLLAIAFAPYAIFHLLFHETITVRYALPLVVPIAYLAASALTLAGRIGANVGGAVLVAAMLWPTLPAVRAYGSDGSPAFRAFRAMVDEMPLAIGMHAGLRRVEQVSDPLPGIRKLRAPHGQEWMALVEFWREHPTAPLTFLADPRRTDVRLFDPQAVVARRAERWTFPAMPFVGGTRPGAVDVVRMQPPGWMLDRGWALTAEIGGVSARDNRGPHLQPTIAWVRARPDAATLMIGGRNLGAAGDPVARITIARDSTAIESWDVSPGFFFRILELPAGSLSGDGYIPLTVTAAAADGSKRAAPVSLEQFDLQPAGAPMFGFVDGWGEPEYNPTTAQAWRWMSESATLWMRPTGRDVTVTLRGESPLRYFDRAPTVRVSVAGREIGRFVPSADFEEQVTIPAGLLTAADDRISLESDLWFSPGDQGAADRRHLALRVYAVTVSDRPPGSR
jgi:hypothetical protein